jgi:hypothetical protein
VPAHPGDPEEVFATTEVPPLTLVDAYLAAEALVGTVMMTFAVTVTNGAPDRRAGCQVRRVCRDPATAASAAAPDEQPAPRLNILTNRTTNSNMVARVVC